MAIKVKLRQKPISTSMVSLYLDFYPPIKEDVTGKETRRQFLKKSLISETKIAEEKYIVKKGKHKGEERIRFVQVLGKNGKPQKVTLRPLDKARNEDTLKIANQIRANRENELNKPEIYTGYEQERLKVIEQGARPFYDYFQKLANKRSGTSQVGWNAAIMHLRAFAGEGLKFTDINETFCNDFRDFLLNNKLSKSGSAKLANNTVVVYFSKFRAAIRQAYKDGFIQTDLNSKIEGVQAEETRRSVLTLDEVNALVETECSNPILKQAAIFSIYTGLRFSDIQKLTWGEIEETSPDNFVINFRQKKTGGIEALPIAKDALYFVGERKGDGEKLFNSLLYSAYYNKILAKWIGLAGIRKDITFHSFRHSFATLQLTLGTDIYTISKLLGHRDIKTTQIYAKIIDQTKRTAANKIQLNITKYK